MEGGGGEGEKLESLLSPISLPFSFPPSSLTLSTPATQANFFFAPKYTDAREKKPLVPMVASLRKLDQFLSNVQKHTSTANWLIFSTVLGAAQKKFLMKSLSFGANFLHLFIVFFIDMHSWKHGRTPFFCYSTWIFIPHLSSLFFNFSLSFRFLTIWGLLASVNWFTDFRRGEFKLSPLSDKSCQCSEKYLYHVLFLVQMMWAEF